MTTEKFFESVLRHNFKRGPVEEDESEFDLSRDELDHLSHHFTYDETDKDAPIIEKILDRIEEARISNDRFMIVGGYERIIEESFSDGRYFDRPRLNLEEQVLTAWNDYEDKKFNKGDSIPFNSNVENEFIYSDESIRDEYVCFFKNKIYLIDDYETHISSMTDGNCEKIFYDKLFSLREKGVRPTDGFSMIDAGRYIVYSFVDPTMNGRTHVLYIFPEKNESDDSSILRARASLRNQEYSLPRTVLDILDVENRILSSRR